MPFHGTRLKPLLYQDASGNRCFSGKQFHADAVKHEGFVLTSGVRTLPYVFPLAPNIAVTQQSEGSGLDDVGLFSDSPLLPGHLSKLSELPGSRRQKYWRLKKRRSPVSSFRHKALGSAVKADLARWCRGLAVRLKPASKAKWMFRPTAALLRPREEEAKMGRYV